MTGIQELDSNRSHFKDSSALAKALNIDDLSSAKDRIAEIRAATPLGIKKENWDNHVLKKASLCSKDAIDERCASLGLPTIPTIVPKTLDDIKTFCKENGTVIIKPIRGHDCIGFKEYHYRPMEEAEVLEEIELDLNFFKNQNSDKTNSYVVFQKFFPLDGTDSYHYSFKGWVNNVGKFTLNHSYTEEWGVDPDYDSKSYDRLTHQCVSNALNLSKTTYETDKAVDSEVIQQTELFCRGNIDSCFLHGDAIVNNGNVYLIDMSVTNNFATLVSFALDGKSNFLIFPIIMPTKGDRKKQIDLVSEFNGYYAFDGRHDPMKYKYLMFLFTGSNLKEIHENRKAYTDAIFK